MINAYLGRCSELSLLQGERLCVRVALALEGHAGTLRSNTAHSDHCPPHAHQPSVHTSTQHAQRSQRLVVIQPAKDLHNVSHCDSSSVNVRLSGKWKITIQCAHHLALM